MLRKLLSAYSNNLFEYLQLFITVTDFHTGPFGPAVLGSGSSLCPGWSGSFDTELPRFVSTFVSVAFMQISKLVFVVADSVVLFQFWFCGLKFRTSDPVTFCHVQLTREAWCRNPVKSLTMATRGTSCDLSLNGWISVSDVWLTARLICSAIISILRSL